MELIPGDGCGNRFLLARDEAFLHEAAAHGDGEARLAAALCAAGEVDGLLLVTDVSDAYAVRVLNRDGSDGGTCLNGLRVVAAWTGSIRGTLRMAGQEIRWHREHDDVALDLPFDALGIPVEDFRCGRDGSEVRFWNPHAVFALGPDVDALAEFRLPAFAARVRREVARFPDGVNVEVVAKAALDRFHVRVDERGVGETDACGSGAVAVATAAWRHGAPARLELQMRGGELVLERLPGGRTGLRGEARLGVPESAESLLQGLPK